MIQEGVLRDASAEAVISANLQPLLSSSFGEGGFSLFLVINREFNRIFLFLNCKVDKSPSCIGVLGLCSTINK